MADVNYWCSIDSKYFELIYLNKLMTYSESVIFLLLCIYCLLHSFAQRSECWLLCCPWEYGNNACQIIYSLLYSVFEVPSLLLLPRAILIGFTLLLCINWEMRRDSHPTISWRAAERRTSINGSNDDDAWCYCCACNMLAMKTLLFGLFIMCMQDASAVQFFDTHHITAICRKIENL